MPTPKPSPRLALNTCSDLFGKLQSDFVELKIDYSTYKTFNFVVTAYHLYNDWINAAGIRIQRQKKHRLPSEARRLFMVWRDITNATKHWKLDSANQSKQVVEAVSHQQIADWHAYLIAGPVIYIDVANARPSLPELADVTMKCFEWLLNDSVDDFPEGLKSTLHDVFRPL